MLIDERVLTDKINAAVFYHNPYDNVKAMARHFFGRCLEAQVTPYVVTKKTVFKWQETFWQHMKIVFDAEFKTRFAAAGLLNKSGGELQHFLSDVATMQVVRWSDGGFGMCAHNYDGDVLTDEIAQCHRSPGFLTSVLNGLKDDEVTIIKEFEASHGTVTDMWHAHLRGEETSLNPLSMMEALIGAMRHSVRVSESPSSPDNLHLMAFSDRLQKAIHAQMVTPGKASRDLSGPSGLTTEAFVDAVRARLDGKPAPASSMEPPTIADARDIDYDKMRTLFKRIDVDGNGTIDFQEFCAGMKMLGITPPKM